MTKNKLFLTLSTVALGIAMVGIANAATIDNAVKTSPADSTRQQVYMTQDNLDAMKKAMNIKVDATQDSTDQNAAKDTGNDNNKSSDSQAPKDQPLKMGPQMMDSKTYEQMTEYHKTMPQGNQMAEVHQSMAPQAMQNMPHNGQAGGTMMKSGNGSMMGR